MIWDNIWLFLGIAVIAFAAWSLIRLLKQREDSERKYDGDNRDNKPWM